MGAERASFSARLVERLFDPVGLAVVVLAPVFWLARGLGIVADEPLWALLGALPAAWLLSVVATTLWRDATEGRRLWSRMAVETAAITLVMYTIGWGPTLAIGLFCGVVEAITTAGTRATKPAIVLTVAALGVGQTAIALGIAPTLVPQPLVHGLAVLAAMGVAITIKMFERAAMTAERAQRGLRRSEERFKALVQHASDIIMVIAPDASVEYVSPAIETVLGIAPADVVGTDGFSLAHPDDIEALTAQLRASPRTVAGNEVRMRHRDGTWHWFDVTGTDLFDDPNVGGWVANLRDITERKDSERALLEAQEAFRHAFDDAAIGMGLADFEDGKLIRVNRALAELLGRTQEEIVGMDVLELTHPDDREGTARMRDRILRGETDTYRMEKRYLRKDGSPVWVALNVSCVRDAEGNPLYTIGQMEDITDRKALSDRLVYEATHDPLTGLVNRAGFAERLAEALDDARARRQRVAVLFVDIDHFKVVNDGLGHVAGDRLLMTVAERLRRTIRPDDVVARFGGDEFVVLCPVVTGAGGASEIAQRVATAIAQPIAVGEGEVFATVSIGIALAEPDDSVDTVLRHADAAMYRAKREGRARCELHQPDHYDAAATMLKIATELHRAIERDELVVHYQPVVELTTARVIGFEALLRWNHPERGLLDPSEFVHLAEESGLIVEIGAWVMENACRQAARWQSARESTGSDAPPLAININLSPRQLSDPMLPKAVARTLKRTGVPRNSVCFEITEYALMHDVASAADLLHALRDLGVHLSIDDFGTGYSSMSYLKRFPVESLKIDRGFIDGLGTEPEDSSIVAAIVTLAHSLGMTAIAEGVETPVQLAALRDLGCDYAQGYLLGRPQPPDAFAAVVGPVAPVVPPLPATRA